ncbi:phage protein Gp27 family protein [Blastomonas fulva]|uniref:phage protein Gp27 family protein n=1 Tax=Blastomonas fulva TaxID=1550728 RepID=UPI0025A360AB|nr:phage protein Gp27 family protein [Blastomonas fulva]MDM7928676.1 DUF3486 family protein [Blastomonas fulva]MDM7964462.1 DUF3486 family protein [Blastomonas fulva]
MARRARPKPQKHTPSTIDRADPEVRALINELRIEKGWTIDEIKAQLEKIGQGHISRSALGRHVRTLADISSEMRETQIYAEALAKQAGNASQSELLDLNGQLLHANMFRLILAEKDGEGIQLSPKEAKEFSEALRNLALARKTDLDVVEKAERRAAEKATKQAAEKATTAARAKGLSKDTVEAIRHAVLGSDA